MAEHSEVNIRTPGLYAGPSDINKSVVARNRTKYQPISINNNATASITVPNISGQVEFNFTTSNQQWLDLFNSHFFTKFTLTNGAGPSNGHWSHLTQNMIDQAYIFINGIQIAHSINWAVASQVNKRMQFSKQYNQSINNVVYESDATVAQSIIAPPADFNGVGGNYPYPAQATGIYTDKEYLDGFFIRDRDSCWIPPNSTIRILLTADSNGYTKAKRHPHGAAITSTCLINSIEFVAYSVFKAAALPPNYTLKFITNSITSSTVATDCNRSLTVDPNIVKCAIVFQQAPVVAIDNVIGGENLAYATQNERTVSTSTITGVAGAAHLERLQIQLGSIVLPPQQYDFTNNLHREAYEDYMMLTGKTLSYETQESFLDWLTEPIYLFDFPRSISDKSTNLIIRGAKTAGAVSPTMHIIEMDEQLVDFTFDPTSGACVGTKTMK